MNKYLCSAKDHGVEWQLNRSYCLTCTPGHIAAQHGNCATVIFDTAVLLGKFQAASVLCCHYPEIVEIELELSEDEIGLDMQLDEHQ